MEARTQEAVASRQPFERGRGFVARLAPEKPADVDAAIGKPAQSDIALRVEMDFEVRFEGDVHGVRLESVPLKAICLGLGTPTRGLDNPLFVEGFPAARVHAQFASDARERFGKEGIEVEA